MSTRGSNHSVDNLRTPTVDVPRRFRSEQITQRTVLLTGQFLTLFSAQSARSSLSVPGGLITPILMLKAKNI
jgi:hypothetical protein